MKRRLAVIVAVAVVVRVAVLVSLAAQSAPSQASLLIGMWKQDMARSTYGPGLAPPKGSYAVRQYAAGDEGSIVAVTMNVNPQGLPSLGAISAANYDGREYSQHTVATLATSLRAHLEPVVNRTISYRPIDLYNVEIVQKQNGVIVSKSTRSISRDGHTMTERFDFVTADGQRLNNVLIFEKQ